MRKVLPMSRIREMEPYMDAKVLDYIHEGQIEAFEGFEDFDLIAFDWYDVRSERTAASQMLLYLDREDLFVFCEDDAAEDAAQAALLVPEEEALSNEQVLHRFFVRLLRGIWPIWTGWRRTSAMGRQRCSPVPMRRIWTGSSLGGRSCCG